MRRVRARSLQDGDYDDMRYEVCKLATLATFLIANNLSWKNWQQNRQQSDNRLATTSDNSPYFSIASRVGSIAAAQILYPFSVG
jgi:hypothetical protein